MSSRSLCIFGQSATSLTLRPCSLRHHSLRNFHRSAVGASPSASDKLFADAAREEAEEAKEAAQRQANHGKLTQLENQHQNWTGEESMQDVVLRMLVDKYKPLRSGPIRTADQKLKESPPHTQQSIAIPEQVNPTDASAAPIARPWQEIANEPLLPGIEGHKPWHTTYKPPSHASASIKYGNFVPSSARSSAGPDESYERTRRTERELAKRRQQVSRLTRARESTLDYRLGLRGGGDGQGSARSNPVSLKGWQSLVEDRIEKARLAGQFDRVQGRGKPITRLSEERNPFIAREEFLMNRIVQRNGAAPPWVEVQMELESALKSFRETLRQSWARRAIRTLTISRPATRLSSLSLTTVTSLRDQEWEERERSYHDTAIAELNSLVRKHNAMAPYAVRRPYYVRDAELAKAYQDCGQDILRGIAERSQDGTSPRLQTKWSSGDDGTPGMEVPFRLGDHILQWMQALSRWVTKADRI